MPTKAARDSAISSRGFQPASTDADQGLEHDHQYGCLYAEQRAVDDRNALPKSVEQAQAQHDESAGQHEQDPGRQPAAHTVHQPAEIGRELGRLRPRQQHAEIERMQEARLVDPFFFVDHDAMHHARSGRPARRN